MTTFGIVITIIAVVLIVAVILLYYFGNKFQKKQEASEAQMKASAQTFSILVIDKKKMKLKDAGLPKIVLDQTPKYMRRSKVPIVKAKIGPKVASLICDAKVFDIIPVKKEIKAVLSGIYIMDVKGLRGNLESKQAKKGLFKRIAGKFQKN
jgi:hypothetical protein